jgi:hypothetical protein
MSVTQVFSSPIALIFFNRPDQTEKVFWQIREAKPTRLFLISDGPRTSVRGEREKVEACRKIVADIDWPCEVLRNYSDQNLGCKRRVISGLDWVFSYVNSAIILEDDCLPSEDFFSFTDELLKRYEQNERVGAICGTNLLESSSSTTDSYFFSKLPSIWGWATWARVWRKYDGEIKNWPANKHSGFLSKVLGDTKAIRYWSDSLDEVYRSHLDTWDYQFTYHLWQSDQLAVIPSENLISNIGFGLNATHTLDSRSSLANIKTSKMVFPLNHPVEISPKSDFDKKISGLFPGRWRIHAGRIVKSLPGPIVALLQWVYSKLRLRGK